MKTDLRSPAGRTRVGHPAAAQAGTAPVTLLAR